MEVSSSELPLLLTSASRLIIGFPQIKKLGLGPSMTLRTACPRYTEVPVSVLAFSGECIHTRAAGEGTSPAAWMWPCDIQRGSFCLLMGLGPFCTGTEKEEIILHSKQTAEGSSKAVCATSEHQVGTE